MDKRALSISPRKRYARLEAARSPIVADARRGDASYGFSTNFADPEMLNRGLVIEQQSHSRAIA
jgi:hypothetical protein